MKRLKNEGIPILCRDTIFKSIFTKHKNILSIFIDDITGIKLNDYNLSMNELQITRNKEKFKKCDFVITSDNYIFDIELNSSYSKTLLIKNTSYVFNLFASNTDSGKTYNKDLYVYQININNYSRNKKQLLDYQILNYKHNKLFLDNFKIYDLDIVKASELYYNEIDKCNRITYWGALFRCKTVDEMRPILEELIGYAVS